ncbi:hypothetical protein K501DRAFT_271414 [Backusella circina FSU 941]|nr:hypothetical protein K501DRAFT_271414 [Backusella circina FSU 941]
MLVLGCQNNKEDEEVADKPKSKARVSVSEDLVPPSLSQGYNKEFTRTFGHTIERPRAGIERDTSTSVERKLFEEATVMAEKAKSVEEKEESVGEGSDEYKAPLEEKPKVKCIDFGEYIINTWYTLPYLEEYLQNETLYICEVHEQ